MMTVRSESEPVGIEEKPEKPTTSIAGSTLARFLTFAIGYLQSPAFDNFKRRDRFVQRIVGNTGRLQKALDRCGTHDTPPLTKEPKIDLNDPSKTIKSAFDGFKRWVKAYLESCPAQQNNRHHIRRLTKLRQKLEEHFESKK